LLDNKSTANVGNRISDSATVTLKGGAMNFANNGGAINYSESAGQLSLASGGSTVAASQADSNQTSTLTFASLSRTAGASVDFAGTGFGAADGRNSVIFTTAPSLSSGIIGAWATYNGSDFATYSANGVTAYTGYTDVTRLSSGTKSISNTPAANIRITEGTGTAANISLAAATTTINTLNQSASGGSNAATIDLAGNTLQTNGILMGSGAGALTIGTGASLGTLKVATSGGELILNNQSATNALTINSAVADNSASSLTKTGSGTVVLTGANTYTGATTISAGTLQIGGAGSLNSGTAVSLAGGTTFDHASSAAQTLSGVISGTGALSKSGSGTLILSGLNTYTGGTTVTKGILALNKSSSGAGTIRGTATVAAGATLRLDTGDATGYNTDGTRLSLINLNGGTLNVNTTSNETLGSATINMTGGLITGIANSNLDFYAGGSAINTLASATTSTISGMKINLRQNNGVTFTVAQGSTASGIDLDVSSVITNSAGFTNNVLTKAGTGTMRLTGANTYSTGTTISGGTLVAGIAGALGGGNVSVNAGKLELSSTLNLGSNATLSIADGATLKLDALNSTSLDGTAGVISLTGNYSFGSLGGLDLNGVLNGLSAGSHYYTLFSGGSAVSGQDLQLQNILGVDATVSNLAYNSGVLTFTSVPEPGAVVSLIGGVGMLLGLQRRRRNSVMA
jgi:autotransporter-associated beta strand protein